MNFLKKGWFGAIVTVSIFLLIIFGGPRFSSWLDMNYRKQIDANGDTCFALLYMKKEHKGRSVHFRYVYKEKAYKNHEAGSTLYKTLRIGDSIRIKIDSTEPGDSYILTD